MIKLVRYHTWHKNKVGYESAVRCALVKTGGTKWLHVLAIDATTSGGLKLWKVPLTEDRYMQPLLHKGKPYPMARALKVFRKFAKEHGLTNGAKKLLREAGREHKANKELGAESTATSSGSDA